MKWLKSLTMVLGGVSFALVLLLLFVIAPIGLLFLVLNEPVSRFMATQPTTSNAAIYSAGFIATVIGFAAITAYRFLRR